jgi:hypothetical protein
MPQFRRSRSEMDAAGTRAAGARAPGLDMKFVQQRAVAGKADQILIRLGAVPPFNAFGRALEAANRFAFRAQAAPVRLAAVDEVWGAAVEACAAAPDRRECIALVPGTPPGGPRHSRS